MDDYSALVADLRERADDSEVRGIDYADTPQRMRAAATVIQALMSKVEVAREALRLVSDECSQESVSSPYHAVAEAHFSALEALQKMEE